MSNIVISGFISDSLGAPYMKFCIFALIMAIQTAPDMSWIIAIGVVAIILSAGLILGFTMPKFKIYQKLVDKITLLTRENLTGLKVIRAFDNEKLVENIKSFVGLINKTKPSTVKGKYMLNISVSTTMGPGIKIDSNSFDK